MQQGNIVALFLIHPIYGIVPMQMYSCQCLVDLPQVYISRVIYFWRQRCLQNALVSSGIEFHQLLHGGWL